MNDTYVSSPPSQSTRNVLDALAEQLDQLTPETRKAAAYVLENPNDVGVSSIREIAAAADVKPNTFVRMARHVGYEGYDDFRTPFREQIRQQRGDFPDRARWLQTLSKSGKHGRLYGTMASSAIANLEATFAGADARRIKAAADAIIDARKTYVLGMGINHTLARGFAYLADMALDSVEAIPRDGSLGIDDIAGAGDGDVLIALTFKPFRSDVMATVERARRQGLTIIGISDSPASPLVIGSDHGFVVQTETPQFFTSTIAAGALLETLMAFVVADASPDVIANIERFHERRFDIGLYEQEPGN
jgi:DNA-binding MurR/RpiR family transcriptional regulator